MAKKILFIEDEPDQIAMVGMRLEAVGYEMLSASDGKEGLKKVSEEKPDLILLDMIMPKMDGLEVCRRLKETPDTAGIPVIVITATGEKDAEKRCRDCGAEDFVKKPYESKNLVAKIEALLK